MNAGRSEWRYERANHFLRRCLRWCELFVGHSKKTIAHAHVELAGSSDFQREMMKLAPPGSLIKGRFIGPIANQVITLLIVEHPFDTGSKIVRVSNGKATRLLRQIV